MIGKTFRLELQEFSKWIPALRSDYRVIAPVREDAAIIYDDIDTLEDLPQSWIDDQEAGHYRIKHDENRKDYFAYTLGPHSWKSHFFPPERRLLKAIRNKDGLKFQNQPLPQEPSILLGVRACELKAIEIQDRVFMHAQTQDPYYVHQRKQTLIIALNCSRAGKTCFCTSMQCGPEVQAGFDLALTECCTTREHYFLIQVGTKKGAELLINLNFKTASETEIKQGQQIVEDTAKSMKRQVQSEGLSEDLKSKNEHPYWQKIAETCMSCANCTMVCPTCFCSSVEDKSDLSGDHAERWRKWDSCFTLDHSYLHGGSVHATTESRYRQWLTHKFSSWVDQFDTSGCVGCGRCITWCPVGIDVTEALEEIRKPSAKGAK